MIVHERQSYNFIQSAHLHKQLVNLQNDIQVI